MISSAQLENKSPAPFSEGQQLGGTNPNPSGTNWETFDQWLAAQVQLYRAHVVRDAVNTGLTTQDASSAAPRKI